MHQGLLDDNGTSALRVALTDFTVDTVDATLGPNGRHALAIGDRAGVERALPSDAIASLIRLFLLGAAIPDTEAAAALHPLPLDSAQRAGLIACAGDEARAAVEIRPYAEAGAGSPPWWVVSDLGADVRPGPLSREHVLGIGSAAVTLAQLTPRPAVARALDLGTGCGVQALHLGRHASRVTATDISARALRFAATTAALCGQQWDLRAGSLLDPIPAGETFDLVVANPPFVVSDGRDGYRYRDSGQAGDALCASLVRGLPRVLAPHGSAHLLANWQIAAGSAWTERVDGWLAGSGCDAWVWQREVADPAEYVTLWLRDAGLTPDRPEWAPRYQAWLDWFAAAGVVAVGMGYVSMWAGGGAGRVQVLEDLPQAVDLPAGGQVSDWIGRARWLAHMSDDALLESCLRAGPGLVRERTDTLEESGWSTGPSTLRQSAGLRWEVAVDDAMAGLVAACSGHLPLRVVIELLAAALDRPAGEVAAAALPAVRDLVGRGFLLPPDPAPVQR